MRHRSRLLAIAIASAAGLALSHTPAGAAQPEYKPPYVLLPNILYVIPYAVSTQPTAPTGAPAVLPDAETIVTIGIPKGPCKLQVEWIDWDGTSKGLSGPTTPPPPLLPAGGSLQYHTQAGASPPLPGMPPYILNVFSDLREPFEGKANIRSDCSAKTKLQVDAGFEVRLNSPNNPNGLPRYKRIPVVRPAGNTGG